MLTYFPPEGDFPLHPLKQELISDSGSWVKGHAFHIKVFIGDTVALGEVFSSMLHLGRFEECVKLSLASRSNMYCNRSAAYRNALTDNHS